MTIPLHDLLSQSRQELLKVASGYDDSVRCQQAVNLPNHWSWTIGHVTVTLAAVAAALTQTEMRADDFTDDPTSGTRYATGLVEHGSVPRLELHIYPDCRRSLEILDHALETFADVFSRRSGDESVIWENRPVPLSSLAVRYALHTMYHASQLASLRLALRRM